MTEKTHIYLDNAASGMLDGRVLEAMLPYLTDFQGNPSSVHHHGRILRAAIEKSRKTVADLLNGSPSEIIFTSGGTEADNFALKCAANDYSVKQLISSVTEHHAVSHTLEQIAKEKNIPLVLLAVDNKGNIDLNELEFHLKNEPKSLVSLMHGNNEIGTLHPIENIGNLVKSFGAIYHSDTVQTMGHFHFNTQTLPVDFLVGSAHKFYGPKGIGFLYRKADKTLSPLICGGFQERNQRAGTENVAGIVGLAKALELCYRDYATYHEHLWKLKTTFEQELLKLFPNVIINGETSKEKSLPTVINVTFPYEEDKMLLLNLDMHGISASGGSACTSGSVKGSHVLHAIGVNEKYLMNSIRFSFGIQNTLDDIYITINTLKNIFELQNV